jgi:hypothetical protein
MYSHMQNPAVEVAAGTSASPLDTSYHVYGCHVQSSTHTVTMVLDGVSAGTFTGAQVGAGYFLIMESSLSNGQASWEKSEGFVPNATTDMSMGIAEVQVYQR